MAANEDTNGHTEAASDLEKKIIKQIEFYFGDKNYAKDKFLRQKADEDEGWVTLDCLATFNRLKALSTDTDAIAKALRKSDTGLVEVSEDNKKVRRAPSRAIPENTVQARQDAKARTVYCKGFSSDTSLDELEEFFADKGKVSYIFMRRDANRLFKGSVFVEFVSTDEAKGFVALESLKYKEEELIKMMKDDYYKKKEAERVQRKEEENKDKQKEGDVKKEEKEDKKEGEEEADEEEPLKYDNGCVLHFKNVGEQTSREDLKSLFGEHEDIAWVDFTRGETEGFVRFSKEGGAQRVIDALKEKNDGKIVIREVETTLRVLEGQEEKDYWKKVQEEREKARQKKAKKFRGGQGGRGRGKRRGFDRPQKRQGEGNDNEAPKRTHTRFDEEEPEAKKTKTEED